MPSDETIFQCLIECINDQESLLVIEEIIPIFSWLIKRLVKCSKKLNAVLLRVLEFTFTICEKIPCKCSASVKKPGHYSNLRMHIYEILSDILAVETSRHILKSVEIVFASKTIEQVFKLTHKQFEYCNPKAAEVTSTQPAILSMLAKETFKVHVLAIWCTILQQLKF